ncbi:tumor necrosis factor receptor superfamily member 10B [Pipistrellus kuhlii]|uniref:TNFR-Cys domain-containing protein n=1 Tax=Pipistrellus kuhlii TaxID=59472 RepID=A0A7J7X0J1_PIPKU|nr:tumor necrosis factor receptor superfamily member 10B [Pipistrellus kuhlii]KAF6342986.1 hypothetical protein mPipKuh1_010718 [Pipistrellus kuhlii]
MGRWLGVTCGDTEPPGERSNPDRSLPPAANRRREGRGRWGPKRRRAQRAMEERKSPRSPVPFAWLLWPLLLLLGAQAAMAAGEEPDDPNQRAVRSPSDDLCEAGHYLTEDCYMGQARGCCPCPPGSFLSHPNREESCMLCARCREDQEMVSDCTLTRDRQCQCKPGEYYCDSEHCLEGCYPCTSCPGATLEACTATRDTVCAAQPGPAAGPLAVGTWVMFAVIPLILIIAVAILIAYWWRGGCVSTGCPFRTESLVPESSGPFVSSPETRDADAPVPAMGARLLPEGRLDVASESLILPGPPERPAGVDSPWPEVEAGDEAGPHAGHHGLTLLHFLAALA